MKKSLSYIIIVTLLALLLIPVITVLAAYTATITVTTNSSFTTTSMASGYVAADVDFFADNGYIATTGLDTRVKYNGSTIPFMLDEDLIAFANPLTASSVTNFEFSTGNSALSNFDITIGDGGTITTADDAGLEPEGNDFDIILDGYFDTATPEAEAPILSKGTDLDIHVNATDGSLGVNVNGSEVMSATGVSSGEHEIELISDVITDNENPEDLTTYEEGDPYGELTVTSNRVTFTSWENQPSSWVYKDFGANFFNGDFEHTFEVMYTGESGVYTGWNIWALTNTVNNTQAIDDANGDYLAVRLGNYNGTQFNLTLQEINNGDLSCGTSSNLSYNTLYYCTVKRDEAVGTYGTIYLYIYDAPSKGAEDLVQTLQFALAAKNDFQYSFTTLSHYVIPTAGTISGYVQNLIMDTSVGMGFIVDDEVEDTYIGGGITDNSDDWILDWDTIKYLDYYSYDVADTPVILYQPDSIIYDDTLPNELNEGTYDGAISWGSLDNAVVTISALVSGDDPLPPDSGYDDSDEAHVGVTSPSTDSRDMAGETGQGGLTASQDDLSDFPLYPLVSFASDRTGLSVSLLWILLGFLFVILCMLGVGKVMPNHLVFMLVAGLVPVIVFTIMTIFPWWIVFVYVVCGVTLLTYERVPSV